MNTNEDPTNCCGKWKNKYWLFTKCQMWKFDLSIYISRKNIIFFELFNALTLHWH